MTLSAPSPQCPDIALGAQQLLGGFTILPNKIILREKTFSFASLPLILILIIWNRILHRIVNQDNHLVDTYRSCNARLQLAPPLFFSIDLIRWPMAPFPSKALLYHFLNRSVFLWVIPLPTLQVVFYLLGLKALTGKLTKN